MNNLQYKATKLEYNSAKVGLLKLIAKKCKVLGVNNMSEVSLNVGNS